MKVFISGKITEDPDYKAKFERAQRAIEAEGAIVINPSLLPKGLTSSDYMRICLAMIDSADAVYFLPDWHDSPGAVVEYNYCRYVGKRAVRLGGEDFALKYPI